MEPPRPAPTDVYGEQCRVHVSFLTFSHAASKKTPQVHFTPASHADKKTQAANKTATMGVASKSEADLLFAGFTVKA